MWIIVHPVPLAKPEVRPVPLPKFLAARGYTWGRVVFEVVLFAGMALSASILAPAGLR